MSTSLILSAMRQKVASILQEKVAKSSDDEQRHAKLTGLAGVAGGVGAVVGQKKAINNLQASTAKYVHTPESAAVAEKLIAEAPTGVHVNDFQPSPLASNYQPITKTVNVAKDAAPEYLAHELGHAKIDSRRLGRVVQNPLTTIAGMSSPLIGLASGGLTAKSDNKWVRRAGVVAPLVTSLPQLGYEGAASVIALRDMKRHGASPAMMSAAKRSLGNAFGTYAANAGLGVGTAAATQGIRRSMHLKDRGAGQDEGRRKVANVAGDVAHAVESAPARGVIGRLGQALSRGKGAVRNIGEKVVEHEDKLELGGLGTLGVVPAIEIAHGLKKDSVTGKRDLGTAARGGAEAAGLSILSAPYVAKVFGGIRGHH